MWNTAITEVLRAFELELNLRLHILYKAAQRDGRIDWLNNIFKKQRYEKPWDV